MNTIPITFNQKRIPYTIIGGMVPNKQEEFLFSALILNRSGFYNFDSLIKSLLNAGCGSILSVTSSKKILDFDKITNEYPQVKFLLTSEETSVGEIINIGISELKSEYVLVLWSDQILLQEKFFNKIIEDLRIKNRICTAPILINKDYNPLYTQIIPVLTNSHFYTEQTPVIQDKTKTIYPFDFTGIYNCKNFIDIGGFDYTITNPYWQNSDFGFRAYLWGYEINISTYFKMQYLGVTPPENIFADNSYGRFYIKNLAPAIKNGIPVISMGVLFSYIKQMGLNPIKAVKEIKAGRIWLSKNQTRFKKSAYELITQWSPLV